MTKGDVAKRIPALPPLKTFWREIKDEILSNTKILATKNRTSKSLNHTISRALVTIHGWSLGSGIRPKSFNGMPQIANIMYKEGK